MTTAGARSPSIYERIWNAVAVGCVVWRSRSSEELVSWQTAAHIHCSAMQMPAIRAFFCNALLLRVSSAVRRRSEGTQSPLLRNATEKCGQLLWRKKFVGDAFSSQMFTICSVDRMQVEDSQVTLS